jgi:hypothetical protein
VIVTARLDLHALQPTDGVIIIHPQKSLDVEGYARFLRAGGRLVLLDDYGTGDALLTHFGMERVPMPDHPAESLRGNPSLAIAEPAGVHPVVNDVARVVTNHATGIRHPDLTPVLEVRSAGGERAGLHSDPSSSAGRPVLLAVAGAVANGRLLVVGDSSIVMNSMLRYAGNKMFARNLLHYAADDGVSVQGTGRSTPDNDAGGSGKGRVFLVEGSFEQIGTFGEDTEGAFGERMRSLRDALASVHSEGFPPMVTYLFAVLVGLGIVLWTGSRAGRTHKAATPRFTRAIPLAQQGGVAGHAAIIGGARTPRILAMIEKIPATRSSPLRSRPDAGWPPRCSLTCDRYSFEWPRSRRCCSRSARALGWPPCATAKCSLLPEKWTESSSLSAKARAAVPRAPKHPPLLPPSSAPS